MARTEKNRCLALDAYALARAGVFDAPLGTRCNIAWNNTATGQELTRIEFWLQNGLFLQIAGTTGQRMPAVCQNIRLCSVPCHSGGARRMFLCPGKDGIQCGRRCSKLYLVVGRFLCRECGNLTYQARQQHDRRKDALLRNPFALISALQSRNPRQRLVAVGAMVRAVARQQKSVR